MDPYHGTRFLSVVPLLGSNSPLVGEILQFEQRNLGQKFSKFVLKVGPNSYIVLELFRPILRWHGPQRLKRTELGVVAPPGRVSRIGVGKGG